MNLLEIIQRTAIEPMGYVGSLYDVCRECVIQQLKVNAKGIRSQLPIICELISGDANQNRNILQMIGFEQNSRVITLLNSSLRTGINALLDHPYPFNNYTRFLHCQYIHRFEELPDLPEFSNADDSPTHMITGVHWGIEVVVVVQLPSNVEMLNIIDEILRQIQAFLRRDATGAKFSLYEELLFEKNVKTTIYSNVPSLTTITSLFTLCQYIHGRDDQLKFYRPLKYRLEPIRKLYPGDELDFFTIPLSTVDKLEQHLIQIFTQIRKLKFSLQFLQMNIVDEQLQQRLDQMKYTWTKLNDTHEQKMTQLHTLLISIHRQEKDISQIDQILQDYTPSILHKDVAEFYAKQKYIINLQKQNLKYYNAMTLGVTEDNYVQILLEKLMINPENDRIICSSDGMREKNPTKWKILFEQLIEEHEQNPSLNLIYVDFTYCSFELSSITLLPKSKQDEVVNILLLGESGVGKSTFINAFVNYLAFDTMQKAESKEPITLIPISFLITTGDNFQERIVYFGPPDNFSNEDFDHPGESVTQQCKSYIFTLPHLSGTKLRIIDTPGFGDTRGMERDEMNMQHIFKYLSNFTHLNAVCFLLKGNGTQLNKYFVICLAQLLDLLGSDARENIIFGFTNTRSTFYTPGNIAPLLKNLLQSFSTKNIPFKKENTFCFDNESFRYLVALRNGINLVDDEQKGEYERSWRISLKESYRLVNYITRKRKVYTLDNTRESVSVAQREITKMVRPILETMKNNLRHIILRTMDLPNRSIQLSGKIIQHPMGRCFICPKQEVAFELCNFLIAVNDAHEISNHCHQCNHKPNEHYSIDYVLDYQPLNTPSSLNQQEMENRNEELLQISVDFAYFLIHVVRATKEDSFQVGLTNMAIEEIELCQIGQSNTYNLKLVERLRQLRDMYEDRMNQMTLSLSQINLRDIYGHIQKIRTFPEISQQLIAAEESQRILMTKYEHIVPENLIA